jgi:hypothetical protein
MIRKERAKLMVPWLIWSAISIIIYIILQIISLVNIARASDSATLASSICGMLFYELFNCLV